MIAEIAFILILTLLFVALLVPVGGYRTRFSHYRGEGRAAGVSVALLFYFLILFPLIWAISAWVGPVGPMLWGIYWMPILLIGLALTLLIAAVTPRPPRGGTDADVGDAAAGFGVFFFLLLILGIGAAIAAT